MGVGNRTDPFLNFRFAVEIDSNLVGGFSDVSGLNVQMDVEEYQEGGVNDMIHQLPKGVRNTKLTLKRGITDSDYLWRWQQDIIEGRIQRRLVNILLLDTRGNEKQRWQCLGAFPVQWTGPELQATGNSIAIEALELVHQGVTKVKK